MIADLQIPKPDGLSHLPTSMVCGVYFLWQGETIVYVGQSRNITHRIYQHIQDGVKRFDGMSYISVKLRCLLEVERYFIEKLIPPYNQCGVANAMRRLRKCGYAAPLPVPPAVRIKPILVLTKRHVQGWIDRSDAAEPTLNFLFRGDDEPIRLPMSLHPIPVSAGV